MERALSGAGTASRWLGGLRRGLGRSLGADTALALAVGLVVVALHLSTDALATLDRRLFDAASTWGAPAPSDRIVVVAIDDASIGRLGRWPWPRDIHAQLIDRLAQGHPRLIVHTTLFLEPQADRGLDYIRRLHRAAGEVGPTAAPLVRLAAEAESALDADARLATSLAQAGNVLLPAVFTLGQSAGPSDTPLPDFLFRQTLPAVSSSAVTPASLATPATATATTAAGGARLDGAVGLPALRGQFPLAPLGRAAAGVGHLNLLPDADGVARSDPLLLRLDDRLVPSLALLAAAQSLRLPPGALRTDGDAALRLGRMRVPTDMHSRVFPQFYPQTLGRAPFAVESVQEVLTGQVPPARFTDRIVVIGATAAGVGVPVAVPGHPALSPPERLAHVISSLLGGHGFVQPDWGMPLVLGLALGVLAYLAWGLPHLGAGAGAAATGLGLLAFFLAEWLLLAGAGLWLPLVLPATLLLLGHLALTTRRFLLTEAGKRRSDDESAEAHRMMGLALLGQGQPDMAFDRFRRVPLGAQLMDNLYQLALDFERRRQFNKAESVYAHMARFDPGYADLPQRRERARRAADAVMLGRGSTHPGGTLVLDDPTLELPTLGRYRLDKVLGQGAMGRVYLGHDPKIGRPVAIKTLALGEAFEGDALTEARARFFREAETAGRLAHPHIVTIFDAGEEQDLAYIAMEYVPGHDLSAHTRTGQLLPPRQVTEFGLWVAQALDHAHRLQVVHRDIKPANLLWVPEQNLLKVTDFGIARLADQARTRTGTLLGTPGYMAPEQLAGQRVDGRSDLYALGATLFQLLTGRLPFESDSLAELMYRITQQGAPDLRSLRPDLPQDLADILARLLRKAPEARHPDGASLAAELQACLDRWPASAETQATGTQAPDLDALAPRPAPAT